MRRSILAVVGLTLALFGCDGGGDPDGGTGPTDGAISDGGTREDGATSPGDGGGADGSTGLDAGPPMPVPRMEVRLDRPIVERDNERLTELTVTCIPRDEDGLAMADPGDLEASVDASDATRTGAFSFTFPTRGSYVVTCASASLGLSGTERVEVAYEGIDRDVIRLAARGASIGDAMDRGLAAARAGDEAAVRAAGTELAASATAIDLARYASTRLLVPFDWPTESEAVAAGLGAGADDAAWTAALSELSAAIAGVRTATAALPTTGELTPADDAAYASASARLQAASAALEALEPSPAATLASMSAMDALVSTALPGAMTEGGAYVANAYATAAVPPPSAGGLTLVGALVNIGIQHVLNNYTYTAVLKKVGRVILENFIQLAIQRLIDELIPPDVGAPQIDLACQASCSFLSPGGGFYIDGSGWDSGDPGDYAVIFIHPNVSGLLADVVGLFTDAAGVLEGDHWIQIAKNIKDIIQSIRDVAATTYSITDSDRVILRPASISPGLPDLVDMPLLPTGVNCSFLPRVGTFIPVRFNVGRGPSYSVNIVQESC